MSEYQEGEFYLNIATNVDAELNRDRIEKLIDAKLSEKGSCWELVDFTLADEAQRADGWDFDIEVDYCGEIEVEGSYSPATRWEPAEYPDLIIADESDLRKELEGLIKSALEEAGIGFEDYDVYDSRLDDEDICWEKLGDEPDYGPDPDEAYDRWKDDRWLEDRGYFD